MGCIPTTPPVSRKAVAMKFDVSRATLDVMLYRARTRLHRALTAEIAGLVGSDTDQRAEQRLIVERLVEAQGAGEAGCREFRRRGQGLTG